MNRFETLESRRLLAADLVVTAVTPEATATGTDGYLRYSVTVQNTGDVAVPSGRTNVRVNLSADDDFANTGDDKSLNVQIVNTTLNPGASTTLSFVYDNTVGNKNGFYKLIAGVDQTNVVVEKSDANNFGLSETIAYYEPIADDFEMAGTSGADRVSFYTQNDRVLAVVNDQVFGRRLNGVPGTGIFFDGGAGDDRIAAAANFPVALRVTGGAGKDTIIGGAANDELSGANGSDKIYGGAGDDLLVGGAQGDRLYGDDGNDTLNGHGGNDWFYGGAGRNEMFGAAGSDRFFSRGNALIDLVSGGAGTDTADADANDVLTSM